jgi:hypothetical protein
MFGVFKQTQPQKTFLRRFGNQDSNWLDEAYRLSATSFFTQKWHTGSIMIKENSTDEKPDKRFEKRQPPEQYYSVQFSLKTLAYIYQFKIWNTSLHGLCILVNEDSDVLSHMQVGDVIDMKYYVSEKPGTTEDFKTEVRHITKQEDGRFKGHCLVGLLILDTDTAVMSDA